MNKAAKICAVSGLVIAAAAGAVYGGLYGSNPGEMTDITITDTNTVAAVSHEETVGQMEEQPEDGQTEILLSDGGITVSGKGASVSGNTVTITKAGIYSVSGILTEGQICVNAGSGDSVIISLNGADITNSADAALLVENAGNALIVLEEGSVNRFQSGAPVDLSALEDDTDSTASGGAVYSKDDLAITGTGNLQVLGYINNGIHTANNLTVDSGNIVVTAVNNGIKGKDSVTVTGGDISIRSGGDGIKSDDTTGEGYGSITISGGSIDIESDGDGIQAETELNITGGEFSVITGTGSENAAVKSENNGFGGGRGWQGRQESSDMDDDSSVSTKGIKCGGVIRISGGEFSVDSYDDAIHSNDSIYITGGNFTLASGDDGIHADKELEIQDGSITVTSSYEGLEGNQIRLYGGNIDITAYDDGINACGGQDLFGGRGGFDAPGEFGSPGGFGDRKDFGGRKDFGSRSDPGGFGDTGRLEEISEPGEFGFPFGFGDREDPGDPVVRNDSAAADEDTPILYFLGANVTVNAGGDGIDSNGSIYVEDGTIIINGPVDPGNGAIDSGSENGGVCAVNGGTVLAVGSAGMDEGFSSESSQCSFRYSSGTFINEGSEITISDSEGNILFSHTAIKKASSIVFSSPDLKIGETYLLTVDGQTIEIEQTSVSVSSGERSMGFRR